MLKGKTQDECILESPSGEGEPFTDSDPWRVFRIMGEFVEGFDTLAGLGAAISIFGSARTQPDDPPQYLPEQPCRYRNLGQLEGDVAAVADHLCADLDQLLPQRRQRPVRH